MATLQRTTGRLLRQVPQNQPLVFRRQWHKDYNPSKEDQTVKLPDGRTIGFAEYGDLKGIPVFAFHGSPGCRYDGLGLHDIAKQLGVRIIFTDRPGHGLSTFQPNRRYTDFPADISFLAKHLGIPRYHVAGQSGGGPHVLACAHGSPKEELLSSTVIAGMAPPEMLTRKDAGLYTTAIMFLYRRTPRLLRYILDYSIRSEERMRSQLKAVLWLLSKKEQEDLSKPEAISVIIKLLREAYAQGVDGVFHEIGMMAGPWGFELKVIEGEVKLYYGCKESRTPLAFGI